MSEEFVTWLCKQLELYPNLHQAVIAKALGISASRFSNYKLGVVDTPDNMKRQIAGFFKSIQPRTTVAMVITSKEDSSLGKFDDALNKSIIMLISAELAKQFGVSEREPLVITTVMIRECEKRGIEVNMFLKTVKEILKLE
jgi:hypothetical protein